MPLLLIHIVPPIAQAQPFDKPFELPAADGVLELLDGFSLDLPDALAGDLEDLSDFLQGVSIPCADPVSQLQDLTLPEAELANAPDSSEVIIDA